MAHGWDSYFNNLPSLSSDPSSLRRTSESEESLSQQIETFIGHHDFSNTVASHEAPSTNSNFNMNYFSNPSIGNSSSDCVYQSYYKETPWQADGEQINKDYLSRCGNSDASDFDTDGVTSGSFPSSFAEDLQGFKQACGMLGTSFLEEYSDVSNCSDTGAGESRPPCKYMASNTVPKSKTDVTTEHISTEWMFTDTGNMSFTTESVCPNVSETNESPTNVKSGGNIIECAQKKLESQEKTLQSDQSSTISNKVAATGSEAVEDRNDSDHCQEEGKGEGMESCLTEGQSSNIQISQENLAGNRVDPRSSEAGQTTATSPNIMATFAIEQDHLEKNVSKKEMKESVTQESEGLNNPNSTDVQDKNLKEDKQNKNEVPAKERKESGSLKNRIFDEHKSSNPTPTDKQNKIVETSYQEIEIWSTTSQSSDPPSVKMPYTQDGNHKTRERSSTLESNTDGQSCLQSSEQEIHKSGSHDNICEETKHSIASHSESCSNPNSSSTDVTPHLEKEIFNTSLKKNTISADPGCSGSAVTKEQSLSTGLASCSQLSTDRNSHVGNEWTSAAEKTKTTFSPDQDRNSHGVTNDGLFITVSSDRNVLSDIADSVPSCPGSTESSIDVNPCPEKEWSSHTECTSKTSCPDEQQSIHQNLLALEPESLSGDVTENARESFEEMAPSTQKGSVFGVVYGEPLSREDSSCDTDETKLDPSKYEDSSVGGLESNRNSNSGGQPTQLKSSTQMRKHLQPVVILRTLESVNGMTNSYHCTHCQHTTQNADHLIEHHYCCHSACNFQFCKACDLYLIRNEKTERHLCSITKESPRLFSDSNLLKKRRRLGRHKCTRCQLVFSKLVQYIKHMRTHTGKTPYRCDGCGSYFAQGGTLQRHQRIPGRCKKSECSFTNSEAVIGKTKTPTQKDIVQNKPCAKLLECYVRLVDIYKTHLCNLCGRSFSTADKCKKHYNTHKVESLPVSSNLGSTKPNSEKTQQAENETRGKYKCPLCPRLFKYSYNRARHLRDCVRHSVCGGKDKIAGKYRCPLCCTTFTLSCNRYRHIKTFCLRDCLNRLAKERAKSRQEIEQKKMKEMEKKAQSKDTEQKPLSKENEQKKQAPPALKAPKTVPRYKCNLCPAVFCHASGKYRHMKKHELFKHTGKMIRYRNSIFSIMSKAASLSGPKTEECKENLESTEAKGSLALSCNFCGKCFTTSQSLKKHEHSHRGERPYRCLECGKAFKKRAYLIGHKIVHQRRIQCTVCRKILPTIGELIQHRSSHLKRGKLQCPDCHLQFQYPAHLLRHLAAHKNKEKKATQLEEKLPLKPQQSLEPVKEQSGPKQLQCSLCKEVFNDAQLLRKHSLTHISGSSSNQCPFCKHNFSCRRYLLRHMIKHTGDKPFSCADCGKQFYRDIYLKLHLERCLPAQTRHLATLGSNTTTKRPHQCSYCPRAFCKKIRLKNHLRGHKTNSLLLCSRCGQYFGFRKLNQHQRNCVGTAGLSSPNGDTESNSQTNPSVHKMHSQSNATKMLQFKCPHCSQRYRYRSLLLRHLVSHTGVQPYACIHCGHRFRSQTMCLQHEAFCDGVYKEGQSKGKSDAATNSSNMPTLREQAQKSQAESKDEYKCKFCTKTFMKSRNLRRHILTHNEVKPYRCKACDSCFSRYDHLKVHQARCKGKRQRLEVCIPKITLDDVGKGWQNRFGVKPPEKETFDCDVCSRSFPTQSKLSRHNTMFHVTKLHKCTRCGSSFAHEKSLKKHRKMRRCRRVSNKPNDSPPQETDPPTENVGLLPSRVKNRVLQRIQPFFSKKYNYLCSYCPRAFTNRWQLGIHTRLHTGEKPYSCDCGERFIRKDYLQRHFPKCPKNQQPKKELCDKCGGFFSQVELENHKKNCIPSLSKSTVSQSKPTTSQSPLKGFSCAYCSSRFLLFSQLQNHFLDAHKMETTIPPVSTSTLQHHLSNIENVKEEPLDESCDGWRSSGANLICKLDTALDGEVSKPLSCPECKLSFTNKAGLVGHLRVHSAEHPFNCKTCKRGFWSKTLLRNHYRKCRLRHTAERNTAQQLEVPLKAEIDFALNESVLVFKEGSKTTGTGVLQTNFSCKEDESVQNSEGNHMQGSSDKEKKTVQYQCSECDQSFTDGLMLISHLEDHGRQEQEKKRTTCKKCGRVCSNPASLQKHLRMHEIRIKKFSCSQCNRVFYTLKELEIHKANHQQNGSFACKLCTQKFWTRPSLCNHYSEEHPDDVFTCHFCNKTYAVKKSLARHYRKWHQKEQRDHGSTVPEKGSIEQQSSFQVNTTGESDEDENNSTEDSDSDSAPYFPCHVCGKTFPTSESLEDHQRCHLGEKPHECAECGRCFFQASQLQQHQRMHKSEFQCQACGRGFVSLFALRKHKHTHGKSRPYRCSKCDFSFTGPLQLAEHMSTHQEENFPCDICNCVFLSKSSRAEHRKVHSKPGDFHLVSFSRTEHEKPASPSENSLVSTRELKYRCGVCSERFRDPEELSEHGCMAAKERPYFCSDCDKHFLHASHLKKHRITHQLPWSSCEYPCNQCNTRCPSSQHFLDHLKSHINTTTEIKPNTGPSHIFICPVCRQCFASAAELLGHFPIHANGTFECKICKMTFFTERKLEEHEHCHMTSAAEFECMECGQGFLGSDAFCKHHCSNQLQAASTEYPNSTVKTNPSMFDQAVGEEEEIDVTGEDLYNCHFCRMQFSSKSGFLEHQNKHHPNEKAFKCELCGKTFALRRYLKEHERRHRQKFAAQNTDTSAKSKPNCTQCHTTFDTAQDLSLHMRLHAEKEAGEYRCDMCYKSFSQKSLLKQHQESHVGQVVYECTECDKAFAFPHLLEEHQQTHAGSSQ